MARANGRTGRNHESKAATDRPKVDRSALDIQNRIYSPEEIDKLRKDEVCAIYRKPVLVICNIRDWQFMRRRVLSFKEAEPSEDSKSIRVKSSYWLLDALRRSSLATIKAVGELLDSVDTHEPVPRELIDDIIDEDVRDEQSVDGEVEEEAIRAALANVVWPTLSLRPGDIPDSLRKKAHMPYNPIQRLADGYPTVGQVLTDLPNLAPEMEDVGMLDKPESDSGSEVDLDPRVSTTNGKRKRSESAASTSVGTPSRVGVVSSRKRSRTSSKTSSPNRRRSPSPLVKVIDFAEARPLVEVTVEPPVAKASTPAPQQVSSKADSPTKLRLNLRRGKKDHVKDEQIRAIERNINPSELVESIERGKSPTLRLDADSRLTERFDPQNILSHAVAKQINSAESQSATDESSIGIGKAAAALSTTHLDVLNAVDHAHYTSVYGQTPPARLLALATLRDYQPDSEMPPPFIIDQNTEDEDEYEDEADQLLKTKFYPLADPQDFVKVLTQPFEWRSRDALYALAANAQSALQAWQDEYLLLDQKTALKSNPLKRPAAGGRLPMDPVVYEEMKEAEIYGYIYDAKKPAGTQDPYGQKPEVIDFSHGRELRTRRGRDVGQEVTEDEGQASDNGKRVRRAAKRFDAEPRAASRGRKRTQEPEPAILDTPRKRGRPAVSRNSSFGPAQPKSQILRINFAPRLREESLQPANATDNESGATTPEPGSRRRGRPPGSKNLAPRSDAGIKKGPRKLKITTQDDSASDNDENLEEFEELEAETNGSQALLLHIQEASPTVDSDSRQATPSGGLLPDARLSPGPSDGKKERKSRAKSEKRSESMQKWWAERKLKQKAEEAKLVAKLEKENEKLEKAAVRRRASPQKAASGSRAHDKQPAQPYIGPGFEDQRLAGRPIQLFNGSEQYPNQWTPNTAVSTPPVNVIRDQRGLGDREMHQIQSARGPVASGVPPPRGSDGPMNRPVPSFDRMDNRRSPPRMQPRSDVPPGQTRQDYSNGRYDPLDRIHSGYPERTMGHLSPSQSRRESEQRLHTDPRSSGHHRQSSRGSIDANIRQPHMSPWAGPPPAMRVPPPQEIHQQRHPSDQLSRGPPDNRPPPGPSPRMQSRPLSPPRGHRQLPPMPGMASSQPSHWQTQQPSLYDGHHSRRPSEAEMFRRDSRAQMVMPVLPAPPPGFMLIQHPPGQLPYSYGPPGPMIPRQSAPLPPPPSTGGHPFSPPRAAQHPHLPPPSNYADPSGPPSQRYAPQPQHQPPPPPDLPRTQTSPPTQHQQLHSRPQPSTQPPPPQQTDRFIHSTLPIPPSNMIQANPFQGFSHTFAPGNGQGAQIQQSTDLYPDSSRAETSKSHRRGKSSQSYQVIAPANGGSGGVFQPVDFGGASVAGLGERKKRRGGGGGKKE